MTIKIYQMNDVVDWVAAESEVEAREFHRGFCLGEGMVDEEIDTWDESWEMTDSEMDSLTFFDDMCSQDASGRRTFREELDRRRKQGDKFPCFFACSEY